MKDASKIFGSFFRVGFLFKDRQYRNLLLITLFVLSTGTVFYRVVEGWGWLDSLYFCVISLSTVGYGDLSPKRPIGKIFTMFYLLGGISILLGFINAIATHRSRYLGGNGTRKDE